MEKKNNSIDTIVIGIGNEYRNDDGVGLYVARKIKEKKFPGILVKEASGEGTSLIDSWDGASKVILIDAVSSKNKAGKLFKLDANKEKLPSDFFHYSSHAFSLAEAIELARTLGKLPKRTIIFGIEGINFSSGSDLSPEIKKSANETVKLVEKEINLK